MKVLVLIAGCVGVFAFFQPFFDYGELPVSAYRIIKGFSAAEVGLEDYEDGKLQYLNDRVQREQPDWGSAHRSPVPFYFLSAIAFVIVGLVSVLRGRFSGFAALFSLAGAMLGLGGWAREVKLDRMLAPDGGDVTLALGATLLLVSSLLALIASLVVLVKREPERPVKPPRIELPEARLVR